MMSESAIGVETCCPQGAGNRKAGSGGVGGYKEECWGVVLNLTELFGSLNCTVNKL